MLLFLLMGIGVDVFDNENKDDDDVEEEKKAKEVVVAVVIIKMTTTMEVVDNYVADDDNCDTINLDLDWWCFFQMPCILILLKTYAHVQVLRFVKAIHVFTDVDECVNTPCPRYSQCVNNEGSFQCHCLTGYYKVSDTECRGEYNIGSMLPTVRTMAICSYYG